MTHTNAHVFGTFQLTPELSYVAAKGNVSPTVVALTLKGDAYGPRRIALAAGDPDPDHHSHHAVCSSLIAMRSHEPEVGR